MLTRLRLHAIRCFGGVELTLDPAAFTLITGANAQGKTTLLEAVCVLLRLQSPRASGLGELTRFGESTALIEGDHADTRLRVLLGARRELHIGGSPAASSREYLEASGRVVWMGNDDIQLIRGGPDGRRRLLDFCGSQFLPGYGAALRAYDRALRSRNALFKSPAPDQQSLDAYAELLIRHGETLRAGRAALVDALAPHARAAQSDLSATGETLDLHLHDAAPEGVAAALHATRHEERRRRRTLAGPHRDDLVLNINTRPAAAFASEGQQRSIALALKLAQARLLAAAPGKPPLLLLDDIFGELDPERRHRLLHALPAHLQKIATTTSLDWARPDALPNLTRLRLENHQIQPGG